MKRCDLAISNANDVTAVMMMIMIMMTTTTTMATAMTMTTSDGKDHHVNSLNRVSQ